jgi:PHD/YefM family antitoxin component YafN of YafNO toxin-antitoxin module
MNMDKIFELVLKRNEKVILADRSSSEAVVILNITEFERMAEQCRIEDLSEEELIRKINEDIALWRAKQENSGTVEDDKEVDSEERYYLEPLE